MCLTTQSTRIAIRETFNLYHAEAAKLKNVILGGRLGSYVYVDMHQAIAMALNTYTSRIKTAK